MTQEGKDRRDRFARLFAASFNAVTPEQLPNARNDVERAVIRSAIHAKRGDFGLLLALITTSPEISLDGFWLLPMSDATADQEAQARWVKAAKASGDVRVLTNALDYLAHTNIASGQQLIDDLRVSSGSSAYDLSVAEARFCETVLLAECGDPREWTAREPV